MMLTSSSLRGSGRDASGSFLVWASAARSGFQSGAEKSSTVNAGSGSAATTEPPEPSGAGAARAPGVFRRLDRPPPERGDDGQADDPRRQQAKSQPASWITR